ncbi:MAG: hypothetical protein JSU57_06030 [Candidatus Heimdallarchaeota archaeon]|nr:MAG: hypothetical protein JSU57_06030 [Candidatus Heimdallarchaeota archaeon]
MEHSYIQNLEETPSQNIVIIFALLSAVASIIIWMLMRPTEAALKAVSPYGVMELEFAWTAEKINQIFNTWTDDLVAQELNVTLVDFGFLVAYSIFLASVTLLISRKLLSGQIQLIGLYMTLIPFVAALFDALENFNLILMLSSPTNFPPFSPLLASIFASLKFGLIIIVVIFWIVSILWFIYQRFSK